MKMLELEFDRLFRMYKPMNLSDADKEDFRNATHCRFCEQELKSDRVRDHCHMTGKYRGAAHKDCNWHYHHRNWSVPVFCHNMKGYDSHFLVSEAHKYGAKKLDVVAQNSEKFLTFSFDHFQFKDSFAFLGTSLEKLVKLNKYTKGEKQPNWDGNFHNTRVLLNDYVSCLADFDVLTEKGVFPYSYTSDMDNFDEQQHPPKEAFHNDLADEACSDELYARALDVWDRFNCKTLGDYHDVYLFTDVGLLADVFENFREMAMQYYGLDPAHYLTLPHFSWDAMLKYTGVEMELMSDLDMYNMVEGAKRGGMVQATHRHAKANNKYVNPELDKKEKK